MKNDVNLSLDVKDLYFNILFCDILFQQGVSENPSIGHKQKHPEPARGKWSV